MRKVIFITIALAVAIGVVSTGILHAHGLGYYGEEDVKVDVKKVGNGIQLTVISDDPEIAKDLQEHTRWYKRIFEDGGWCPMRGYRHGYSRRGCM